MIGHTHINQCDGRLAGFRTDIAKDEPGSFVPSRAGCRRHCRGSHISSAVCLFGHTAQGGCGCEDIVDRTEPALSPACPLGTCLC